MLYKEEHYKQAGIFVVLHNICVYDFISHDDIDLIKNKKLLIVSHDFFYKTKTVICLYDDKLIMIMSTHITKHCSSVL